MSYDPLPTPPTPTPAAQPSPTPPTQTPQTLQTSPTSAITTTSQPKPGSFDPVAIPYAKLIAYSTITIESSVLARLQALVSPPSIFTLDKFPPDPPPKSPKEDLITTWLGPTSVKRVPKRLPPKLVKKSMRAKLEFRVAMAKVSRDKAFVHLLSWKKQVPKASQGPQMIPYQFYGWRCRSSPLVKEDSNAGEGEKPVRRSISAPLRPRMLWQGQFFQYGLDYETHMGLVKKGLKKPPTTHEMAQMTMDRNRQKAFRELRAKEARKKRRHPPSRPKV